MISVPYYVLRLHVHRVPQFFFACSMQRFFFLF
jgi:hypothetical protein